MFEKLKEFDRTRLILGIVILITLPCYCLGMVMLWNANLVREQKTPTATFTPQGTLTNNTYSILYNPCDLTNCNLYTNNNNHIYPNDNLCNPPDTHIYTNSLAITNGYACAVTNFYRYSNTLANIYTNRNHS